MMLQRPQWESAKVSHKRVFALLTPEIHSYEWLKSCQKAVFALPGCQRMSVSTLLCDALALADASADNILASDCRTQLVGRESRMCMMLAMAVWRDNVLASRCE